MNIMSWQNALERGTWASLGGYTKVPDYFKNYGFMANKSMKSE